VFKPLGTAIVGLVLAFCGIYLVVDGVQTLIFLRTSGDPGWRVLSSGDTVQVAMVIPGGPAAALLRPGDSVVAIEGHGVRSDLQTLAILLRLPVDRRYHIVVSRGGKLVQGDLSVVPVGSFRLLIAVGANLVRLLYWVTGVAVFVLKRKDKVGLLLSLLLGLVAPLVSTGFSPYNLPYWQVVLALLSQAVALFFWPVFLHFFLLFPERSALLGRVPALESLIYLPVVPFCVPCFLAVAFATDGPMAEAVFRELARMGGNQIAGFLIAAYLLTGLLSLILGYGRATVSSRRKLRVVLAGNLFAFFPFLALIFLQLFGEVPKTNVYLLRALQVSCLFTLPFAPLSFAYAIVRHQVIPVHLIVRRGVRYLLVSRGFVFVEGVVLAGTVLLLLSGSPGAFLDRVGHRADLVATFGVGALVLALLRVVHRRVMPAIDRRFFRDAYDAQQILARLREAERTVTGVDHLVERAGGDIWEALHPASLRILLRGEDGSGLVPVFSRFEGVPPETPADVPRTTEVVHREDGGLVIPIAVKGDLLGALELGPRRGDLPYSREDQELLLSVAVQTALALQNARLVARMVEEGRLRREIEMASEVQQRLFPSSPPPETGLDLAGACRPALGVGGDYYDFLELGDGRIGIAVADVAGKGISAALLMSLVQASLRSQARDPRIGLPDLVRSMNELLYRSTARNRFASFFYAQYDRRSRALSWVNAGHNPPILVRPNGHSAPSPQGRAGHDPPLEHLQAGGLVLGAFASATYTEETVSLHPGDVLVAYTDGVTEAWNPHEEEFGDDRLNAVLGRLAPLSARSILDGVMEAVEAWQGSATQRDDITLIVAKVL
jgi:sigma-B regulation protein RsbU (phosphoserine phosphatase)